MRRYFITSFYDPFIGGGAELSNKLLNEGLKKNFFEIITFGYDTKVEVLNERIVKRINFGFLKNNYLKRIENKKCMNILFKYDKVISYFFKFIYSYKISKILKNYKDIQLIHTSGTHGLVPELWWEKAKKRGAVVIHTLRDPQLVYIGTVKTESKIRNFLDYCHRLYYVKRVEKYVDYIHSPTQYMIDLYLRNGFKFKNTKVIPNTVDIQFELSNYKEKIYDILYVGTLSEAKGIKTLIKSKELNPFLNIIFVGSGELQNEAIKVGIECTGWLKQNEVFDYMKKSKIVILPSEWEEAFGRVLIEGVASGTISIGSNMGGIPEVLFNDSRYIFEAKNVSDLKSKIERVLKLDEDSYMSEVLDLQKRMEIYKYENHIKQFEEFYDEVLRK